MSKKSARLKKSVEKIYKVNKENLNLLRNV